MITMQEFQSLKPSDRHEHIIDGLIYLSTQYAELAVSTKRLNAWFNHLGLDPNDTDQIEAFIETVESAKINADLLTSQIILTHQRISSVCDTLSKHLASKIKDL